MAYLVFEGGDGPVLVELGSQEVQQAVGKLSGDANYSVKLTWSKPSAQANVPAEPGHGPA